MLLQKQHISIGTVLVSSLFIAFIEKKCYYAAVWCISIGSMWILGTWKKTFEQYWILWFTYGLIWENCGVFIHPLVSGVGSIFTLLLGLLPTVCFYYNVSLEKWVEKTVIFFVICPGTHNVFTYTYAWDICLHVGVYAWSFLFHEYAIQFLKAHISNDIHLLFLPWPLFVSKWCIPFIGIQWMVLAFKCASVFSKKHEQSVQPTKRPTNSPPTLLSKSPPASLPSKPSAPLPPNTKAFTLYRSKGQGIINKNLAPSPTIVDLIKKSRDINVV